MCTICGSRDISFKQLRPATDLSSSNLLEEAADVVHFNHALEHCHLPAENMQRAAELSRPEGLSFVIVSDGEPTAAHAYERIGVVRRHLSCGLCVTQDAGFEPLADTMTAPDSIQPCSFASDHAPQTHAGAQEMASRMVEPLVKS